MVKIYPRSFKDPFDIAVLQLLNYWQMADTDSKTLTIYLYITAQRLILCVGDRKVFWPYNYHGIYMEKIPDWKLVKGKEMKFQLTICYWEEFKTTWRLKYSSVMILLVSAHWHSCCGLIRKRGHFLFIGNL